MPGDIFGLRTNSSKLYDKQVDNTWPESANYGYYAGGGPSNTNIIRRIDFSNETIATPGKNLSQARRGGAGLRSYNYAYFGAGFAPPQSGTIDRMDFNNETMSLPGNNIPQARNALTAVSTSNYGYFAGGNTPSYVNTIDRIDFSSETIAVPPVGNGLTQARSLSAVSSSDYGYFAGGGNPTVLDTVDRIDFFNETTSAPGNDLSVARYAHEGNTFSLNYGYFAGGYNALLTETGTLYDIIERIDFNNETMSLPGNNLPAANSAMMGVSGRQTRIRQTTDKTASSVSGYGFYYGGGYPSAPGQGNFVDYATETRTTNTELSTGYSEGSAFTTQGYGYHLGANTTIVKRFDFLNDTRNDNPAAFPSAVLGQGSSTSHYGYICNSNNTPDLDGNKYDFSTETLSMVPDVISVTRFGSGNGCFTSSRYVHFTGGPASSPALGSNYTHMDRLEFATETRSPLNAGGPTKFQKHSTAGCRSNDCGYSMGGSPGYQNTVDKIEFENDTISDAGTFSPQGRSNGALAVSKNYGYFCMGLNIVGGPSPSWRRNRMDRYDFSTSTNVNPTTTFATSAIRGTCMPQDVAV